MGLLHLSHVPTKSWALLPGGAGSFIFLTNWSVNLSTASSSAFSFEELDDLEEMDADWDLEDGEGDAATGGGVIAFSAALLDVVLTFKLWRSGTSGHSIFGSSF
jgi:hypothetical protein